MDYLVFYVHVSRTVTTEVRQTTRRSILFGHIARMPDEADAKKILTVPRPYRHLGDHWDVLV